MKYFESGKAWLAVQDDADEQRLAGLIHTADIAVSDIDETIAVSPSKKAAKRIVAGNMLRRPSLLKWAVKAVCMRYFSRNGKKHEPELWKEFLSLLKAEEIERVKTIITPEHAASSLYKGVPEFYSFIPGAKKVFVTRSLECIAESYRIASGFDAALSMQFDKTKSAREIAGRFPSCKRYVFLGDSAEDEAALDYLKFLWKYTKIETLVSVYVAKSKKSANNNFDISIGRDYACLDDLLRIYSPIPSSSSQ